jgi:hypothetical protein
MTTPRSALAGLALASVALTAVGLALGARSFLSNALAELAGLSLGVVVAVLLADAIVERRRAERWSTVSRALIASIADRLDAVRLSAYLSGFLPDYDEAVILRERNLVRALSQVAGAIEKKLSPPVGRAIQDPEALLETSQCADLLQVVRPDVDYIRQMVIPRALELATDERLAHALIELETAERIWAEGVRLIEEDWGYPDEFVWSHARDFFVAAAHLGAELTRYEYVDAFAAAVSRAESFGRSGT